VINVSENELQGPFENNSQKAQQDKAQAEKQSGKSKTRKRRAKPTALRGGELLMERCGSEWRKTGGR